MYRSNQLVISKQLSEKDENATNQEREQVEMDKENYTKQWNTIDTIIREGIKG
eukprot:CAMPEP_0116940504 /NCGR_PEP_ID=MMETSP0467-20121206/33409_1 /TAXON_ID=283647 /ORGANISM="Mesodinium pulex, Strain SPMC105" /LENGTH=52 /DNA_ID=CAMNT_0004623063 /DNA_START=466 /DNA_END=621 /DNA_ORIENTATION=-